MRSALARLRGATGPAVVAGALVALAACGGPPDQIGIDPDVHREQVQAFADARVAELEAPDSWLSLIGLHWLDKAETTVGSAEDNDIVLPEKAPAHLGSFLADPERVRFKAVQGILVLRGVDSTLALPAGSGAIPPDTTDDPRGREIFMTTDKLGPGQSVVARYGDLNWIIIRRGDRWAVRMRDNAAENYAKFDGIDRYPTDRKWRVTARWVPQEKTVAVPNVLGTISEVASPAYLEFWIDGQRMTLDVPGGEEHGRYMLVFADSTSGGETYGGGRYLWIDGPDRRKRVVLDFNYAYNPPCVWTEYATCPLPTKDNRLPIRVEAGEKAWAH